VLTAVGTGDACPTLRRDRRITALDRVSEAPLLIALAADVVDREAWPKKQGPWSAYWAISENDWWLAAVDQGVYLPLVLWQLLAGQGGR
jgi:hypothetical protein